MLPGEESALKERILLGDKSAFSIIFAYYYADLVMFACTFLKDKQEAEEVVQDMFIRLWENRQALFITTSLKSFLLKSVQNKCIDTIRHLKIMDKYQMLVRDNPLLFENDTENYLLHSELENDLNKALRKFPEEISQVFIQSRFNGFTYHEIADQLKISVRTVEVRMGKALALLRDELKDYLITFLLMLGLIF